jgi:hypothetical protein
VPLEDRTFSESNFNAKKEGTENRLGSRIFPVPSVERFQEKKWEGVVFYVENVSAVSGVYFSEIEKTNKVTEKKTVAWATTCGEHCDTCL